MIGRRSPAPSRLVGLPTVLALIAALGLSVLSALPVGPATPATVRAATPDLTLVSTAAYEVQPEERRVRVTVDLALENHLKDTKTTRYYFDEAFLDVMPGASGFKVTKEGSGTPTVKVQKRTDDYTRLRLAYPRIYSGKSSSLRLTFDLEDPGGAPTRDLRIGDTLVAFPVWAFATDSTPGSSVTVTFPAGFDIQVEAGAIASPTTDAEGRTIFESGALEAPLEFFAYLVGDRPGSYREELLTIPVLDAPASLLLRSWPDDEDWASRVRALLEGALPALGERIGLVWPHEEPLTVEEAVSRSTEGYAGLFDPRLGLVEIAYYADDFVVLHEAAHAWFNGTLLADRWSNEAFASYYATEVATDLGIEVRQDTLTQELQASRIPLNGWGPVGAADVAQEDYAYAASLSLARAIAARAGDDGLRAVWEDAAAHIGAYQPATGPLERLEAPPDWRGLLDLLEARTGATYTDLWRTWVTRPSDERLLDSRAAARTRYDEVRAQADDWRLPRAVRDALRAWRFRDATELLDQAAAALGARKEIEAAAADADLIVPVGLRLAFEDDDGFADTVVEAEAELATIDLYVAAVEARPPAPDLFQQLGLWNETPEADLVAARSALARGELQVSAAASADAAATWAGAESAGKGRAFSIALLTVAGLLVLALAASTIRRHRRGDRFGRGARRGAGRPA